MTRKFTFLLMALLALAGFKSWGQTEIQIGNGTETQGNVPFYNYYYYSYAQMLYLANEIGQSGTITSISFDLSRATSLNDMKFNIYMKCVSKDSYSNGDDWVLVTNEDLVCTTMLNSIPQGWATFTLDNPFVYDNTQGNLMIAFDNNTGSCTSADGYAKFHYTSTSPKNTCLYYYQDSGDINPLNPSAQYKGTTYQRPNIKMTIESSASCPKPKDLAASNVTATGATISWTGSAESYDLAYGVASTFDLSNPTTYTLRDGLNTTSVQLSGLIAETVYKYAVKAHCSDEDESNWSKVAVFFATNCEFVTLNNGTDHAQYEYMPFYGPYVHNSDTKSEIIYPASDLQSLTGKNINNLTFYASVSDHDFGSDAWDVYVKEVNYTNPGQDGYHYTNDYASMSKVYSGPLSINDHKMYIILDESFVYNSQNLMICFQQTSYASGTNADISWDGVNPGGSTGSAMRSRGGFTGGNNGNASSAFLPKTTFGYIPSVTYTVNLTQPEAGGTIDATPKTDVTAGTIVTLSANPAFGYEFGAWVENYEDVEIVNNQFTMPEHDVTISATFNALTTYYITSAVVTGGTVHAEYQGNTITEAPAGTEITLVAEAATDYIFEHFTVNGVQIPGSTYTIGTSNIEIGASFRAVQSYTIHYYVNGVNTKNPSVKENASIPTALPLADLVPAGTECIGWSFDDIATYQTVEPSIISEGVHPTQECNVYAVFKCIETVISDNWEPIWMAPQDGEEVIFANYIWSEEQQATLCYVMCDRSYQFDSKFSSGVCTVDASGKIISAPGNVTIFNVEILDNGNLKFHFNDISQGESTLADLNGCNLVPQSLWGGVDTWVNDWGTVYNTRSSSDYISCYGNPNLIFCFNTYNQSRMYRRASEENSYYMTEVLGYGGADEHIASNTSATNVVIAKNAKLTIDDDATLNVEGICLSASHDAAQLVIAEGGQLVHHNEGTVATFEKTITGYTNAQGNDGYYLIANPTNETTVTNLTSTSNNYDLYTFNPAGDGNGNEWINMHSSPAVANGTGYLYANSGDVTLQFAGALNPAGSTVIELTYAGAGEGIDFPGFNLVGNPYACNAYVGKSFYVIQGTELTLSENAYVAPCEGFFVEATQVDKSVTLSTTVPEPTSLLSLSVSQNRGNVIDRAIVRFDGANDLHKFMLNPQRTNIRLAKNGEEFAAISSENEGEIPVSFKAEKNGSYTITVNTENVEANYLHLIDNLTGMDTDLLNTPSYTFNASTSDYAYRFKLVFSMTDVEENESNANSFAYISNGNLVINNIEGEATMQIVDMLGRVVSTEIVSGSYNKALNLKAGLYIINLNGMTQKIVVK